MEINRDTYIEQTLEIVERRIKKKFRRWCRALKWSENDVLNWVEEVSAESLCVVQSRFSEWESFSEEKFQAFCVVQASTLARDELVKEGSRLKAEALYVEEAALHSYSHDPTLWVLNKLDAPKFLRELSEIQRETLAYYYLCDFSVRDIARTQGIPDKTVYTNLRRARLRAAELYQEKFPTPPNIVELTKESNDSPPPTTRPPPSAYRGTNIAARPFEELP